MSGRLLTVEDVAERWNVSPRFVRRLVFERRIPFLKVGRHVRFEPAAVDSFVARFEPNGGRS